MQSTNPTLDPRRILGRLLQMGWPEMVFRGKQETYKLVDRILPARTSVESRSRRDRESINRFVENAELHFFEGPFDRRVPGALETSNPDECQALLVTADRVFRGHFDLLGYQSLDFGNPVDWHLDPVSGKRAPLVHWSRLNFLDAATVGDSKVIWELNRHQWLVHLAQAWNLTGYDRYAEAVVQQMQAWLRANPPGMGINWASSLEVAFRIIAWCWSLLLIRESRALTPDVFSQIEGAVQSHATHVERYLSTYFSPNTHLTGEALGLFYAGVVFPELKRAERWRSLGTRILHQEVERQVLADGVYFERSTCYQRYTVDLYLHFMLLAGRSGTVVTPVVGNSVKAMVDVLIALRQPDGSMPSIGDEDGGMVLPLSRSEPNDYRATFSTAAVVFNDPVYANAAGRLSPETLWLLGTRGAKVFESLDKVRPAADPSRVFPAGGFAVMRSGWNDKAHSLIFDAGPLGCDFSAGHGHADLLSIQCSAFGQRYLVDAGTCCYTADAQLRDFFRGTAAHSTVMVDEKSQAQPAGPFSWRSPCAANLLRWLSNNSFAYADAEHDAYRFLPDPVSHRRRVAFIKSRYWVVIDDLTAAESHRIDVRFQFAPMKIRIDDAGWVRASRNERDGLLLRAFTTTPFQAAVREGCREPMEGWVSPHYGQLHPAPSVVYTANTALPTRIMTLLWPAENIDETPRVDVMRDGNGRPFGLVMRDLRETVIFADDEPVVDQLP